MCFHTQINTVTESEWKREKGDITDWKLNNLSNFMFYLLKKIATSIGMLKVRTAMKYYPIVMGLDIQQHTMIMAK